MSEQHIWSVDFVDVYNTLNGFMDVGIYNETIQKTIKKCPFNKYEKLLNFLTGQEPLAKISPSYSIYKASLFTGVASHHIDLTADITNSFTTTIQADDKFLFLNCPSAISLMDFLFSNLNGSKRYIFIPVLFGSEVNEVGHFSTLIFDTQKMNVYFADPNGKTKFFDNIFYVHAKLQNTSGAIDNSNKQNSSQSPEQSPTNDFPTHLQPDMYVNTEEMMEDMIKLYISALNEVSGFEFKFVERLKWNRWSKSVNTNYDTATIGSGHCVILSTMIFHYMHITKADPIVIYDKLSKMSQQEIIELINSYSVGIYNILIYA